MKKEIAYLLIIALMFGGCATKESVLLDRSASFLYERVVDNIANGRLDKADAAYGSLQSEHSGSLLLADATLIVAFAHIDNEEYLLGEHFLDEYIRRYANTNQREFAQFLKVKTRYLSLQSARRNQAQIQESIAVCDAFSREYPLSRFGSLVDTMKVRLVAANASLNESIASLYERLDKPKAAQFYRSLNQYDWLDKQMLIPAKNSWYETIFEGDGTSSWYDFLIPDTQSVVSRDR